MDIPNIDTITTAGEAESLAMDWQNWLSDMPFPDSLSYGELSEWQGYFRSLARKFDLRDEFEENGII